LLTGDHDTRYKPIFQVALCGRETFSLTLKEMHERQMFGNKMIRKMF